jgi:hypothetical protein
MWDRNTNHVKGMNSVMKKLFATLAFAVLSVAGAVVCSAQSDPMVGGAAMYPTKDIVDNAVTPRITAPWWPR